MEALESRIGAIEDIRNKRRSRKANIKKIQKSLLVIKEKPLASLPQDDLKRKISTLEENIMAYELLQDRLEELEEHRGEGAGEVDEQRRFNDDLLSEYGLLLKA